MKFLLVFLLFSHNKTMAKDITEYECRLAPDLKIELSLIDPKLPSVSLQKKDAKIARCFYQTLPSSKPSNMRNVSTEASWNLQLSKCETYNEKMKSELSLSPMASFKQAQGASTSYFRLFTDQQPLLCKPRS